MNKGWGGGDSILFCLLWVITHVRAYVLLEKSLHELPGTELPAIIYYHCKAIWLTLNNNQATMFGHVGQPTVCDIQKSIRI